MSRYVSVARKIKEHRGEGHGADYKPWINVSEFNSAGRCHEPIDWFTKRPVELFSDGEYYAWLALRWSPKVTDIREQFPLNPIETQNICWEYGIKHPMDNYHGEIRYFTSDMVLDIRGQTWPTVVSVKRSRDTSFQTDRDKELAFVEKMYWMRRKAYFVIIFEEDMNITVAENIRMVMEFYDLKDVRKNDPIDLVKHLIATRQISVDMGKPINYLDVYNQYIRKGDLLHA